MDFLNKAIAQITDLFRSMTAGARITTGLLLAVLVVSLAYLFNHQSSSADVYLFGGNPVPSNQLAAMEGAFAQAKLSGHDVDASGRVRVPSGQKSAFMAALVVGNALPRGFGDYMINAIKEVGPFGSQKLQKDLLKIGLERELAQIISSIQGIENASVMYDVENDSGLSAQRTLKTASVSVKPQGNNEIDEHLVSSIRNYVAGAIGCKPTDISVTDLNSGRTYAGGGTDGAGGSGFDNDYRAKKREYEKDWEAQIRKALSYIPDATVTVNVELNQELSVEQREDKVDTKPVQIDVEENTHTLSTQSSGAGGRPGLAAQGGVLNSNTAAALTASSGPKTEEETNKSRTKSLASQTQSVTRKAGLTPSRVTATVAVPSNYYEKIWRERNPTPAGEEPKPLDLQKIDELEKAVKPQIEAIVAGLLPPITAEKVQQTTKQVTVMTFQHLASAPITPPSTADKAMFWLGQYWSTLGMIGLGLVSLLVLRSMVRVTPAAELPRSEATSAAAAPVDDRADSVEPEQQEAAARLKRRAKSGPSLRDELADIVREDPDSAANILRNWIGSTT